MEVTTALPPAICAAAINRFHNLPAAAFALAGGIVPWLIIGVVFRWSHFTAPTIAALFSVGPLFLLAFLFYSFEEPGATRNIAAAFTIGGMIAGIIFCGLLGFPFLVSD